jgi:hypothetical protein
MDGFKEVVIPEIAERLSGTQYYKSQQLPLKPELLSVI